MTTINRCTEVTRGPALPWGNLGWKTELSQKPNLRGAQEISCEPGVIAERKNHRQEDNALGLTMIDHRRAKSEASTRHKDKDKARSAFRRGCPGREVRSWAG